MPGSKKAVDECFAAIQDVLPHAIELIRDEKSKTEKTHQEIQNCKVVNKVAPIPNDNIETIKSPIKQENVPVEPVTITTPITTPISTNNPKLITSKASEKPLKTEDFQATVMSEIIIDDTHDILNISSSNPTPEKRRTVFDDDLELKPPSPKHVCPHKTAKEGDVSDRNSIYPMVEVEDALGMIMSKIVKPILKSEPEEIRSNINCPPFRASIKDGYAVKSSSTSKKRTVISYVSAGEPPIKTNFPDDHCFKINTGAPVPQYADAIIQIEDTVLISKDADGNEKEISILTFPAKNLDIRDIGSDMMKGELMFKTKGLLGVPEKTMLAAVGQSIETKVSFNDIQLIIS